ncbi:hypothetical protein Fcan01_14021 [Folsomia candida]|uniref:Uncharacterized protein n=1 Tax=Folsomia candida TaxID=158441 RepID=A0A226DYM1_FOLCA|nr:hypothetical protein Fcan01_14021 [Folsomia candida]
MSIMNFDFWTTFRILSSSQRHRKSVERYARYPPFCGGVCPVSSLGFLLFCTSLSVKNITTITMDSCPVMEQRNVNCTLVPKRFIAPIVRTRCCYVAELDVEQTEMTSAEKNRTLVIFKARGSGSSENY